MPIPGSYRIFHPKLVPSLQATGHFPDNFVVYRRGVTVDAEFNASGAWVLQDGSGATQNLIGFGLWGAPSDVDLQIAETREQIINAAIVSPVAGIRLGDRMVIRGDSYIVVDALRDRIWYKYTLRLETAQVA